MNNFRKRVLGNLGVLSLSATYGSVTSNSGSKTFTIKWNEVALTDSNVTVTSDQSWATPTWTASTSTVKVTCTSNTDLTSTRSATITVTYQGVSATYALTQSKGTLSLSSTSEKVTDASGSTSFTIQVSGSNYTGTATVSSDKTWATTSRSAQTVTVSYTENSSTGSGSSRTATITVTVQGQSKAFILTQIYIRKITSLPYDGTVDGYKYITLGGLKWCINDVDATADGGYGNWYAWGEITTKSNYTWNTYKYGTPSALTKYNATDGLTTLEPSDDVASVKMGGSWRMATETETQTMINNTNWEDAKISVGGTYVYGIKYTSKTDSSKFLFFPACDYASGTKTRPISTRALFLDHRHWTSTGATNVNYKYTASHLGFSATDGYDASTRYPSVGSGYQRYYGMLVRGVHA